jgi:hypothetical protein
MPVSERAAERLFSVMDEVGARLAAEIVCTVYRQRKNDARH